ncbi:FYVE-domain-containing protein [Anaeromyces robustus]|uniref:FYVE-domain-containing protein n=1 Tax=Anaeromyces robustus TaxID=1754192 RepID=A0A1Y1WVV5_9FUNG|nr:FYVE-domain-containing protein [Anaeromyces robustus]|eukprot:ORX77592.1 FYVE-domain-containing protein [Anaeromyces robustus]
MNIYEELRKKRPAHPSIGPEYRSDSSSSVSTAYEANESSSSNQQYNYVQPREINFFQTPSSFVTGPPSKNHWKPDSEVSSCADCNRPFTLINRRHHCRKCGDIFCGQCTNFTARLDQDCRFNPKGIESRICRKCNEERQNQVKIMLNASESSRYRQPKRRDTTPGIHRETNNYFNSNSENISIDKPAQVPDLAPATLMSVPNDWTWSTF